MKSIIRFRWVIIALWIIGAALITYFSPNLQQLVAEKGQITVPDTYPSKQADELLQKMSDSDVALYDLVLVFHKEEGLTSKDEKDIKSVIESLDKASEDLEIESIIDFTEDEEVEASTFSKDRTTLLVPIEASMEKQSIAELREAITNEAKQIDVSHALTGEVLIEEDIIINSEEGLTKTIYITVALILVILFVVFRSLVAPIIPLISVGISYLIAEGIVSFLANSTPFPLSTFTQIFMVAIMFGIGTDYTILIISRFKEEMAHQESIEEAVISTYKASGKTVFYAALAVLIGFATIGLSKFTLYQSAVAVAVGVFVVTIALFTIIPFFLVLLGKRLFWPFDKHVEHKESKLWGALGHFTWTRSFLSLGIILIIVVPGILLYNGEQSYDSLAELSDDYESVKAFNWIEESFVPGEIMPVTVVMELNEGLKDANDFQAIESITADLARMEGVNKVRSATRPAGDIIEDFLLESQTDILTDGLDDILDGLDELKDGLSEASDEMTEQSPQLIEAQDGVQQLMDGTEEVRYGINEIKTFLTEIEQGLIEGSVGVEEAVTGLRTMKNHLEETVAGHKEILGGYEQLEQGLVRAIDEMGNIDINIDLDEIINAISGLEQMIERMHAFAIENEPNLLEDPQYMAVYEQSLQIAKEMNEGLSEAEKYIDQLENIDNTIDKQIIGPIHELNKGYRETIAGQEELVKGLAQLIEGLPQLQDGLEKAADGQGEIVRNMAPMTDGLKELHGGQGELKLAFEELHEGLDELAEGLTEGADGLEDIHEGLDEVNRFLREMDFSSQKDIVVIPDEALEEKEFWDAVDLYTSSDRKITNFDIILDIHPYSKDAMEFVDDVEKQMNLTLSTTNLDVHTFEIGGVPSINNDLNDVSAEDYKRTATLMLIGIFLILIFLLRSLIMPVYLLASLLLTYYTALGFTEFLYVKLVGYDGLTWAIPFFSFVMLIALGVDYSIFLMSRFDEYRGLILYDGMMRTMRNMGTVIISATVILGGTFAAMLPSGVLSLLQIATVVIVGLALYALVILPLFTPIFVKLLGEYNWWPFMNKKKEHK